MVEMLLAPPLVDEQTGRRGVHQQAEVVLVLLDAFALDAHQAHQLGALHPVGHVAVGVEDVEGLLLFRRGVNS